MARRLEGQTVLVTGGAGGIGLATARRVVREGARVVIFDLDKAKSERAAKALRDLGAEIFEACVDVTNSSDVTKALSEAEAAFGPIDGLVNNAGVAGFGSAHECSEAQWEQIMRVNVTGVFLTAKAVLPG